VEGTSSVPGDRPRRQVGDAGRRVAALKAFVAYCAGSSAANLVNEVRDVLALG
jgi:hypothetical protein